VFRSSSFGHFFFGFSDYIILFNALYSLECGGNWFSYEEFMRQYFAEIGFEPFELTLQEKRDIIKECVLFLNALEYHGQVGRATV